MIITVLIKKCRKKFTIFFMIQIGFNENNRYCYAVKQILHICNACVYCISKAPLFEKLSLKKGLPEFYDKNIKVCTGYLFSSHLIQKTLHMYSTYISSKASFLWRSPLFSIVCDTEIHFKKENGQLTEVINKVNYQEPQKIKIISSSLR